MSVHTGWGYRQMITGHLVLVATLIGTTARSAPAQGITTPAQNLVLYSCRVGAKETRVTRLDEDRLVYTFSSPARPQIRIIGDPKAGTISYLHSMYPHAEHEQLRFRNGAYSYVLYARWASPSVRTMTGGEDSSGLLVFKGVRRVARLNCTGDGWPDDKVFGTLPDDGDDITPDPSER